MDAGADFFFDKSGGFELTIDVIKRLVAQSNQNSNKKSYFKEGGA